MSVCRAASENGASVLLLPPMCISGADCGDLLYQYDLLDASVECLLELCELTSDMDMLVIAGFPLPLDSALYKCTAALHGGKILGIVPEGKRVEPTTLTIEGFHVPFGSDLLFSCVNIPALTIGIGFSHIGIGRLSELGATLIACHEREASFVGGHAKQRDLCLTQSELYHAAVLHSGVGLVAENGVPLAEAKRFTPSMAVSEIDAELIESVRRKNADYSPEPRNQIPFAFDERETALTRYISPLPFTDGNYDEVFMLASQSLARRLKHTGASRAVLGLSGGLDSALAALIAANALSVMDRPSSDVLAVLMPGYATGSRTSSNARELARLMGFTVREIDIRQAVARHLSDIGHKGEADVVFENAQARERTKILFDIANAENGIVIGTGDMSELALGFCTYGGDCMSHFGVNADIPKTLARELVRYAACSTSELGEVLNDITNTPISPELLPDKPQLTEEILGSYELNDFFLYHTLHYGFPRDKIVRLAEYVFGDKYEDIPTALDNFSRRFFSSQFKRVCSPDVARISKISLADFKISSENSWR
jgi:NAD+ synthase (glutamine-hydrolysing)